MLNSFVKHSVYQISQLQVTGVPAKYYLMVYKKNSLQNYKRRWETSYYNIKYLFRPVVLNLHLIAIKEKYDKFKL